MENLAQAGEGGGCTPTPFPYIYHIYTHPVSTLLNISTLCYFLLKGLKGKHLKEMSKTREHLDNLCTYSKLQLWSCSHISSLTNSTVFWRTLVYFYNHLPPVVVQKQCAVFIANKMYAILCIIFLFSSTIFSPNLHNNFCKIIYFIYFSSRKTAYKKCFSMSSHKSHKSYIDCTLRYIQK